MKKEQNKDNYNPEKTIKKIYENYENIERSIVNQLLLETPNHYPTQGAYREEVWKSMFEKIIPKKFCIDQGIFIIDSTGNISSEVDLAIFDEQYTPYIFNYGKIKFIPIEAVSVVIQCKSDKLKEEKLKPWIDSINKLTTSLNSVVRVMPGLIDNSIESSLKRIEESIQSNNEQRGNSLKKSQTSTRPISILCSTNKDPKEKNQEIKKLFDICISIDDNKKCLKKEILEEDNKSYSDWNEKLNHYNLSRYGDEKEKYNKLKKTESTKINKKLSEIKVFNKEYNENVILSLTFQLNQLLMIINNPMLFPHEAYAKMFNSIMQK